MHCADHAEAEVARPPTRPAVHVDMDEPWDGEVGLHTMP